MIIGGLVLLTILAFLLINFFSGPNNPGGINSTPTVAAMNEEIMDLEGTILELEIIFRDKDLELEDKNRLLEEKYTELNFMSQKIEELEREGKVDKATINTLKGRLAEAKASLLDTYQNEEYQAEINVLVADNSYMAQFNDSLEIIMDTKDSTIQALQKAINDCDESNRGAGHFSESTPKTIETPKIPILRAKDMVFKNVQKNKSPEVFTKIKRKDLETLNVCFTLEGNEYVPTGEKQVYVVIKDVKNGKTYSNPGRSYSGIFYVNGKETAYSSKAIVKYNQGKISAICAEYSQPENEDFDKTRLIIDLYCEEKVIGSTSFLVY